MKKIYSFMLMMVMMMTMGIGSASAQGWTFDRLDPVPGEVTSLRQINLYYTSQSWASDGLDNPKASLITVTDDKGNSYGFGCYDNYPNGYATLTIANELTTPGTYTIHFGAGACYNYSDHSLTCAAQDFVYTIPQPSGDGQQSEFKVESVKATSADGIIITFNEDVKTVKHNMFGGVEDKCLMFNDLDGNSDQNVKAPKISGKTVTCQSGPGANIVSTHRLHITLQPQCFIGQTGELTGTTEFDVVVDEGMETPEVIVAAVTPSSGNRQSGSLNNISAEFSPKITKVVDASKVKVMNENGHELVLSSVALDSENPMGAISINVDENSKGIEGTTYSAHILPGACAFTGIGENTKEIVFGQWYTTVTPITLAIEPSANSLVESLKTVKISADKAMDFVGQPSDITVKGIMEYQVNTYATATSVEKQTDGSYIVTLDKELTPEMFDDVALIAGSHAATNNVKLCVPEGTFKSGAATNNNTEIIYIIQEEVVVGELTWTFNPEAGSTVNALGVPFVSDNEGQSVTSYFIGFKVEGENAYVRIPDASQIKLVNDKGSSVINFGIYDLQSSGVNGWSIDLGGSQKTAAPEYTLIIPAECIYIYNNAEFYGEATHPEDDVEATWYINKDATAIANVAAEATAKVAYNLQGQRVSKNAKGVVIVDGKKVVK